MSRKTQERRDKSETLMYSACVKVLSAFFSVFSLVKEAASGFVRLEKLNLIFS